MISTKCSVPRRSAMAAAAFTMAATTPSRRTASMSRTSISSFASLGTLLTVLGQISIDPVVPTVSMAPSHSQFLVSKILLLFRVYGLRFTVYGFTVNDVSTILLFLL